MLDSLSFPCPIVAGLKVQPAEACACSLARSGYSTGAQDSVSGVLFVDWNMEVSVEECSMVAIVEGKRVMLECESVSESSEF